MHSGPTFKKITRSALAIGTVATGMMFAGYARADVFDTTLASPDTNTPTGSPNNGSNNASWYNGSGNPQGGWTVSTDPTSGIEIGLRAKYRGVNSVIDTPTDDYAVAGGTSNGTYALWNYEFSVDLRPNGIGSTLTLADILLNSTLTVKDVTTGATGTVLLSHWADSTGFGTAGASGITGTGKDNPYTTTDWGLQNSENLGFADSPLAGFFNPNASDEYDISLSVIDNSGKLLGSTDIEVFATPEPSAIILLSTMVFGLFFLARRRAAQSR